MQRLQPAEVPPLIRDRRVVQEPLKDVFVIALQSHERGRERVAHQAIKNAPGIEHPFGTLKMRMGATHFLMKTLPKVATEMALHVLAYNLTRVMNIVGVKPLLAAIRA